MVNQSCDGFGPYQLLFWMPEQFLPYPSRLQTPWLDATDGAWRQTRASKLPRIETEPVPDKYFLSDRQIKWEEISQPLSDAPWKGWNARRPSAICGSHPKDQMKIAGTLNLVKGIASLPATCAACHRGQLGDDRRPFVRPPRSRFKLTPQSCKLPVEAVERCRVCCRRCPLPAPVCTAAPPVVTPAAARRRAWLECCLFIRTWIPPNTRPAPGLVPDRQIGGFLFCISASGRASKIRPICAQNVQ